MGETYLNINSNTNNIYFIHTLCTYDIYDEIGWSL